MTLGNTAAAKVHLIVWCRDCQHQVEPDPGETAARYGAGTSVLYWRERLVCSRCGKREVDMVVTGTERDRLGYRRAAASRGDRVNLTQWLQRGGAGMG
jgi:hypothetical protein